MNKFVYVTTEIGKNTGGAIYDEILYNRIIERYEKKVITYQDIDFTDEYKGCRPDFLRFNKIYRCHSEEIQSGEIFLVNSRLYTRFVLFPWKSCKKPCIFMIHHHFNFMTEHGIKRLIHRLLEIRFMKKADYIITPNQYVVDMCKKYRFSERMIFIEAEAINNEVQKTEKEKEKRFVFIGTVEPRKGIHYLVKAFQKFHRTHPDFQLVVIGSCKYKKYYTKLLKMVKRYRLDMNVKFTGRISDEEKDNILQSSHAFVFPSQNEGYGLVLVEAMRYGLPVVAFDNTAMPYTVNETNGFLVKNKSILGFAKAMEMLVDNTERYKQLSNGAFRTVEGLTRIDTINEQYAHFFSILAQKEKKTCSLEI